MANPDNAASPVTDPEVGDEIELDEGFGVDETEVETKVETKVETETFDDKVNAILENGDVDDKGKLKFAEGTSDEFKFAVNSEKRRRDTQAEYTKSQQVQAALKAEKTELLKQLGKNAKISLTQEQVDELEELKFSDPDAWRSKLNVYENIAQSKQSKKVKKRLKEVSDEGVRTATLEIRKEQLEEFKKVNKGFELTDDIIANDVPPRITKKLLDNKVTFPQFLQEAHDYLKKGKVVATTEPILGQPNLGKVAGNDTPLAEAVSKESELSYEDSIY